MCLVFVLGQMIDTWLTKQNATHREHDLSQEKPFEKGFM